MVVVFEKNWDTRWGSGDSDPFGGPTETVPVDPSTLPAIVAEAPFNPNTGGDGGESLGGPDPFGGALPTNKKQGTVILAETACVDSARMKEFHKALTDGADPIAT
jgi:hypothetical protein